MAYYDVDGCITVRHLIRLYQLANHKIDGKHVDECKGDTENIQIWHYFDLTVHINYWVYTLSAKYFT